MAVCFSRQSLGDFTVTDGNGDVLQRLSSMEVSLKHSTQMLSEVRDGIHSIKDEMSDLRKQTHGHQILAESNKERLTEHDRQLDELKSTSDKQSGSMSAIKVIGAMLFSISISGVGWAITTVLSIQSSNQIQQTKLDNLDKEQAEMKQRVQQLERKPHE